MKTLRRRLLFAMTWIWLIGFLRHFSHQEWLLGAFYSAGLGTAWLFTFMRPARWL